MNARLMFAATLSLAVVSSFAYGDDAQPLSREQVRADYREAVATKTLPNHEYDFGAREFKGTSSKTRAETVADMNAARKANTLVGPLRNRTYNPGGTETLRPPIVARSEVKDDVTAAMRDGSLRRSDYDDVPVTISRRAARERAAQGQAVAAARAD
jgi:hypothetical protein